jgi:hypothetical protein
MEVSIKRNVILRAVVTPQLREDILAELDHAIEEVDERVQQIDFSTKPYLTELQRTNLQQAITVRKQIEAEKQKHTDLRAALEERKAQVNSLQDNDEIIRGTLESYATLKEGDNLAEVLAGVEVVVKDDLVVEIRQTTPIDIPPMAASAPNSGSGIITDLSGGLGG